MSGGKDASGQPTFQLYFEDNLLDGNANGKLDVSVSDFGMVGTATRLPSRLEAPRVCTDKAAEAHHRVLEGVGAVLPQRDEVDAKLLGFVAAQSGELVRLQLDEDADALFAFESCEHALLDLGQTVALIRVGKLRGRRRDAQQRKRR